jgi:hypothetical protein
VNELDSADGTPQPLAVLAVTWYHIGMSSGTAVSTSRNASSPLALPVMFATRSEIGGGGTPTETIRCVAGNDSDDRGVDDFVPIFRVNPVTEYSYTGEPPFRRCETGAQVTVTTFGILPFTFRFTGAEACPIPVSHETQGYKNTMKSVSQQ